MIVGVVGAGLMGVPMTRRLVAAGHDVRLYARSPGALDRPPARLVPSAAAAGAGADAALLSVTDSPDVARVVQGLLESADPPGLVIDTSTIAPAAAREVAVTAAGRGVVYLDCPVSGGPAGAAAGTLAVMCGGPEEAVARAAPVLDAIGDPAKRVHCGPVGAGLVAKLVNNLLVAVITAGTAEALGMGQRAGVDPEVLRRVVMASSGASWQLEHLFPRVLAGDHAPGFRARHLRKDLGHAQELTGGPLPLGDAASGLLRAVPGDLDYGAVARLFMDLPG